MKNIFYITIILMMFSSCEKEKFNPQDIDEEIDRVAMPFIIAGERVGLAIGTYDNGVKQFYSYGVKNLDKGGEIDENTMFEIGSITKTFTSIALAKLHIQKKVSLESKLNEYFDDQIAIPSYNGEDIKLQHLANHTSSLPREASNNLSDEESYYQDYEIDDFYNFIDSYSLSRAIGSEGEYSNIGTGILGYVLKESQAKSYYDLLNDEIFQPLGMQNTVVNFDDANTSNIAQGYVGNQPKSQMLFSEVYEGAGVLKSNMNDMWKYLAAQLSSDIDTLNQAISLSHAKTAKSDIQDSDIGLAWILTELDDGQNIIWHNGGTYSYNSFIGFNKKTGKGVIILMNSANKHYNGEVNLGNEVLRILHRN